MLLLERVVVSLQHVLHLQHGTLLAFQTLNRLLRTLKSKREQPRNLPTVVRDEHIKVTSRRRGVTEALAVSTLLEGRCT